MIIQNALFFLRKIILFSLLSFGFSGCIGSGSYQRDAIELDSQDNPVDFSDNKIIYFNFGKTRNDKKEAIKILQETAQVLKKNPKLKIIVYGFVDQKAPSKEVNYQCALKRAFFAARKLLEMGVLKSQIYIKASTEEQEGKDSEQRKVVLVYSEQDQAAETALPIEKMNEFFAHTSVKKKTNHKKKSVNHQSTQKKQSQDDSIHDELI